jgi:queuine tRNA-ribosyltransferase
MRFDVIQRSSTHDARLGKLVLPHGEVTTPAFMPVGTQGSVKTLTSQEVSALGFEMVLANTYHLHVRPGEKTIAELGGLHRFMNWQKPILTDSGGYQVMSLAKQRRVSEEGVVFQSHIDGREIRLTPERAIEIQCALGVDIAMALDVCVSYPADRSDVEVAMHRTDRWAPRNLAARGEAQAVFGIVQGGVYEDLRRESAEHIASLPFEGIAIGGVSVGEPTELQHPVVAFTTPLLPFEKPRYLMGVGHPKDILHAVRCGVDLFDCVLPTRLARHHAL